MANSNVPMLDLPFFELCNQAPVASQALSAMTTIEDGSDRYIYYISGSNFYRYDAEADTWQQLSSPNVAPVTLLAMRYTKRRGFHGRVLGATANTVTIPGLRGETLSGETLRIEVGTGAGQEQKLTFIGETIHDAGVITGTATNYLQDTTKKWRVNQWAGYLIGITFGTDATHYKKVLYNDSNTLYISDVNLQPHDPWNNQPYVAAAPYALPVVTAGSQAHYVIMSSQFSVPGWDIIPDETSFFTTLSGGIYMVSSAAAAPFYTMQYYDVIHDSWQTKTTPQGLLGAALGTDVSIERTGKIGIALAAKTGVVTATSRTLTDSGLNLETDRYANHRIHISGGTGNGQSRRIVAHTNNTFTIPNEWDVIPDNTSVYSVWPDYDRVYMVGNGASSMFAYSPENDYWMQGQRFDDGVTSNISVTMKNWVSLGVTSGARIAAGVRAVDAAPTVGGSGYSIGDVLTCAVGGAGAQVRVTSITPAGAVTGLELIHSGTTTGYTVGTGKAVTGGMGTGCTINVTAVGATALITVATAHWFRTGNPVKFAGCTEAAWNAEHIIIGVPSTTTFCVAVTATANMVQTNTLSTTLIVDPSKNWIPNEHVGRLVHVMVAGTAPTSQIRWITANTANTLTVAAITAAVNGTSKYIIYDSKVFGIDEQRKEKDKGNSGWATGGTTTTLVDTSKNWIPNQWANYYFKIEAGAGYGSGRILVISNTENTLTFAVQSFTPNATTKYEIADAWGLASSSTTASITEATYKNWTVNQWAGKRVRITAGTGFGQESGVVSNTATALTTGTIAAGDATTAYALLGIPPRSSGIELIWIWGATDPKKRARQMFSPRGGGSNTFDIYDIPSGKWSYGNHFHPQAEAFQTGSSYSYDGADKIYASRSTTGTVNRIFEFDVNTRHLTGKATTTFLQSTAHIGNLLEMVSRNGNNFLYSLQMSGTLMARALIF